MHTFDTIEELRRGLQDFVAHYNATWLVARYGYRTPNQIRAEQRSLAQSRWTVRLSVSANQSPTARPSVQIRIRQGGFKFEAKFL